VRATSTPLNRLIWLTGTACPFNKNGPFGLLKTVAAWRCERASAPRARYGLKVDTLPTMVLNTPPLAAT
jgi:hypothetical protein